MDSITEVNAIIAAWDAASIDSTFPGGVWSLERPHSPTFPYVVVSSIGRSAIGFSSSRRADGEIFQFSIFAQPAAGLDPQQTMDTLGKTLTGVYNNLKLSLDSDVTQLSLRFSNARMLKEGEGIYQLAIDYELRVAGA